MEENRYLQKIYEKLKKQFPEPIKNELKFIACHPSDLYLFEKLENYTPIEGEGEPRTAGYYNYKSNKYITKVPVVVNSELKQGNATYCITDISVLQQMQNEVLKMLDEVSGDSDSQVRKVGLLLAYLREKEEGIVAQVEDAG